MRLNSREMALAWVTGAVLLFALTAVVLRPKLAVLQELRGEQRKVEADLAAAQRILNQEPASRNRFAELMKTVEQHPAGEDVTANVLRQLEQKAESCGMTIGRRTVDKEDHQGELYEMTMHCDWNAPLEPLVRFLFDLHSPSGMLDVTELYVKPREKGDLQGRFTVNYAYSRAGGARKAEPAPAAGGAPARTRGVARRADGSRSAGAP